MLHLQDSDLDSAPPFWPFLTPFQCHYTGGGSGRKRLNIQGALNPETFRFTFGEGEKINAETTRKMLEKIERDYPAQTAIHVILDNVRYHHARILQPWLESPERCVKLRFLPPYAPHLNAIERLWGYARKLVTARRGGIS